MNLDTIQNAMLKKASVFKQAESSQFETANRPDIQDPWHMDRMAEDAKLEADWKKSKEALDKKPDYWPEMTAGERLTFAINRPERVARQLAARGAINEIKTNGWPNVGMGPYSLAQIRAKFQPIYGNRFFQNLANLAKNPEDLNDSIVKMNREGVAPDTRRSDSTGLMSGNGRALPRILAPGSTPGR